MLLWIGWIENVICGYWRNPIHNMDYLDSKSDLIQLRIVPQYGFDWIGNIMHRCWRNPVHNPIHNMDNLDSNLGRKKIGFGWKCYPKVLEDGPDVNFYQPERKEPETPYVVYRLKWWYIDDNTCNSWAKPACLWDSQPMTTMLKAEKKLNFHKENKQPQSKTHSNGWKHLPTAREHLAESVIIHFPCWGNLLFPILLQLLQRATLPIYINFLKALK